MTQTQEAAITEVCQASDNDRTRLIDIVRAVQEKFGCVSAEALDIIAEKVSCHRVEVESVVSFYAFLSDEPKGKVIVRLCNDPIDKMVGMEDVAKALTEEMGIAFGETSADGAFTLEYAPCIGMCDQAPAAMVNDVIVTELTPASAREMVKSLKADADPTKLVKSFGDGQNANDLVKAMVKNNILKKDEVIFASDHEDGVGLKKALEMSPEDVVKVVKDARLRGRGGAGFPCGMKWAFTRGAQGSEKWVLCNADEGEPGTFKDRVLLTETPDLIFEGMTIGGHALEAKGGILYLRAEYAYLRTYLEDVLNKRRERNLLGKNICGKGFDFDIRIQMGAGAYICGEETALISSCEGLRGDPKNRPPFPAQEGYLAKPTTVNNVETYCCVPRIFEKGAEWFSGTGSRDSAGTKLFSISGDVKKPGVYELPFGVSLKVVLDLVEAEDPGFCVVGGPSGTFVSCESFERHLCYEDLATGGALMVFNKDRDPLAVASDYMEFFIEESCGHCTPCRVGNVLLKERLDAIRNGKGEPADLVYLTELGESVKACSRCGLGQTSPNPILTTLEAFRSAYNAKVSENKDGFVKTFDIREALSQAEAIAERKSAHFPRVRNKYE